MAASNSARGLHDQVVHVLGVRIVSGALAAGETLDVPGLSRELDVSLPGLRSSLRVLAGKGLVEARPKRGTYVRPIREWNMLDPDVLAWQLAGSAESKMLRDLADVRSIVEPAAARRAAVHRSAKDVAAMERALAAIRDTPLDNVAAALEADASFHRALFAATGNQLLVSMNGLIKAGMRERDRRLRSHDDVPDPVPSHRAVLDAIRNGDPDAAERAMIRLIAQSAEDAERLLADRKSSQP